MKISKRSIAFDFRLRSWKSNAPQLKDTNTLERRIIETTEIIASGSDSAKR